MERSATKPFRWARSTARVECAAEKDCVCTSLMRRDRVGSSWTRQRTHLAASCTSIDLSSRPPSADRIKRSSPVLRTLDPGTFSKCPTMGSIVLERSRSGSAVRIESIKLATDGITSASLATRPRAAASLLSRSCLTVIWSICRSIVDSKIRGEERMSVNGVYTPNGKKTGK